MLVGGIIPCAKAIVVGDPKQIEPVQNCTGFVCQLKKLVAKVLGKYRIKELSVQSLADAQNPFGWYYQNLDGF